MDLICILYGWSEGFGSPSSATLPWDSTVALFPPLHVGRPLGFTSCPGGPGSAPVRAGCGGGAAAWATGVLAAPGPQGGRRLG